MEPPSAARNIPQTEWAMFRRAFAYFASSARRCCEMERRIDRYTFRQ